MDEKIPDIENAADSDPVSEDIAWPVLDWTGGDVTEAGATLPAEVPVKITVNGCVLVVLHCTPRHLKELAAGYLLGQGLIVSYGEVVAIEVDAQKAEVRVSLPQDLDEATLVRHGQVSVFTGCGQASDTIDPRDPGAKPPIVSADAFFDPEAVRQSLASVLRKGQLHGRTHGVHSAAVASPRGELMVLREDIGRHNALDKVLGWMAVRGLDPGTLFVSATGRISADAVAKIRRCGIPLMVTRGVPTSMALAMAEESGVTLAGSMGPGRLRIYTHAGRLKAAAT